MVAAQQQDTHYTDDSLNISTPMRPSNSSVDNTVLSADSNLSYDTYVSHVSFSGSGISESNQIPAGQEASLPDSSLSTGIDHGASVTSCQGSDNTAATMHNLSYESGSDQPGVNHLLDLGFKCKGFRMGHINVQGITNKTDQIRMLLESDKNAIHVLGLSETKLNAIHPSSAFEVNGYQKPFRRDRETNSGGGLLVYVKDGISCSRRTDLEHDQLECIWLEIKPNKSKSFLLGNIYRPPNSSVHWNSVFEDCIENILREEKELYIIGDINRDLLNVHIKNAWTEYMEPFGLTQLVSEATRVTSDSQTLIDHVYANCPENVSSTHVSKIGLSDHYPIFFTRKMHVHPPKSNHFSISYRSFNNFDEAKFIEDLQSVPWDTIKLFDDTDDIMEAWLDLFLQVVDKHVPIKQHRVKHKTQPQWMSPEILDAIKCRDRYKSVGNETEYKIWRNKCVKLIHKSKKSKYQTFIDNNKGNPGSIYKIFQEVGAGKGLHRKSNITSVKVGDFLFEDSLEIANEFNDFFVNIASKLKEPIISTNHDKLQAFCQERLPAGTKFLIPLIEREKVLKFLSNIDISKATGTDMIGPRLLKLASPYIVDEICFICNHSITSSVFPSKWKEAKVSPLYKSGPHEDLNNYRPISILPTLSKVLEKHVHDSLSKFLQQHELLHRTQSGFRAGHSCETALVNMIDSWLNAIDNSKLIGIVLVDFKKAFDLVDHQILKNKLKIYGINDEALRWFNNYLSDRKQQVTINNCKSNFQSISCGVPQGSILGPLLFLLFINDLPLYTRKVHTDLYADDTTLYDIQDSMEQIENNLQAALNNLHVWCKENGMSLNSSKTKVMLVTSTQKRQRLVSNSLDLKFNNDPLNNISNDKILGVFVDNNLAWTDHTKHLAKKIASSIWLLSKIKRYLSKVHRVQFYKSYIQPHIDFCNIVWASSSESNKLKIFKLQKRACKVILDYKVDDLSEAMKSLKIMSVFDRLYLRKAKFMFKVYNNDAPSYISENFTLRSNVNTSINLRSLATGCFIPPKPRTEYFKHSMRYSGCLVWNNLPEEVKNAPTIDTFHNRCLKWLVN
ncbi:MAG: reverse transcriptase family protein [Candidatus Thiodiazotropha sp.]